jgi:hypothetical protein
MSEIKDKLSVWPIITIILSILLIFFTIPHTLEDFALGEPMKNGAPTWVLSYVIAGMLSFQSIALYLAGQKDRRSYFIHAGVGIFWSLAAGIAQLPIILTINNYRSGLISIVYVLGMVLVGILLCLASIQALITTRSHVNNLGNQ